MDKAPHLDKRTTFMPLWLVPTRVCTVQPESEIRIFRLVGYIHLAPIAEDLVDRCSGAVHAS